MQIMGIRTWYVNLSGANYRSHDHHMLQLPCLAPRHIVTHIPHAFAIHQLLHRPPRLQAVVSFNGFCSADIEFHLHTNTSYLQANS